MSIGERNERIIREYWERIWSGGDLELIGRTYAPDCVHGESFSIEGFERNVARTREAFPDLAVSIDEIFRSGDRVVTRVTYRGTHNGAAWAGIAATGRSIDASGIDVFVIRDGLIVEHWHEADHLTMFEQLGVTFVKPGVGEPLSTSGA